MSNKGINMTLGHFKDSDIRKELHVRISKDYDINSDTLILDELGILNGAYRVDVAVINGILHGYEIKSDLDTLERLPAQEKAYSRVFDKTTLIVGESHLHQAKEIIPEWWGIKVVTAKKDQSIKIKTIRKDKVNKHIDPLSLVKLLWKTEVVNILSSKGYSSNSLRYPKARLYEILIKELNIKELKKIVRETLKHRTSWRDHI